MPDPLPRVTWAIPVRVIRPKGWPKVRVEDLETPQTTDAPDDLPGQIRLIRRLLHSPRSRFARRLGVTPSIIYQWETARSRPSRKNLAALLKAAQASSREDIESSLRRLIWDGFPKTTRRKQADLKRRSSTQYSDLAEEIRKARLGLGKSRTEFGIWMGVRPSTVFRWETGRSVPSGDGNRNLRSYAYQRHWDRLVQLLTEEQFKNALARGMRHRPLTPLPKDYLDRGRKRPRKLPPDMEAWAYYRRGEYLKNR